ncbi:hypothetical protein GQ43DRAFT_246914 [Delitschia confertaspora ATCC 74209]|uniref:Uncharacterized protein n=1 Tax=Delitschia confertaspora ATCC 74209 TaxID=1513339 RepID=A0A9P4JBY6_9PLEO|nr:hypothetical protein GQ43DRAFT_246914 [Delitschia confertaspora ATCC 74209]
MILAHLRFILGALLLSSYTPFFLDVHLVLHQLYNSEESSRTFEKIYNLVNRSVSNHLLKWLHIRLSGCFSVVG